MTVCVGPSIESVIFSIIVAVLVPCLIIHFVHKKWKIKSKLLSVVIFIALFFAILLPLVQFFTPLCGGGAVELQCMPFEFYPENNTCKTYDVIDDTVRCNQLQEEYLSQLESGTKQCPEGTIDFLVFPGV